MNQPQYLFEARSKPSLPWHEVPLIRATQGSVKGYGSLVHDPAKFDIAITRWPQQGWRPIDQGTGDEGGFVEGTFCCDWKGDVLYGKNDAVSGHYVLGRSTDPQHAQTMEQTKPRDQVLLWHMNYHPDGGQLFFPLDKKPFIVPVALPGDNFSPDKVGAFWCDGSMGLYHRAECLTHVGDSQAVRSLTQCGEPMRFAMAAPIDLRNDFDSVSLRRLAKRTRDATQSRRLLALAEVYDGGSRTDASRIGGVGLQIIRDWVLRFNARGPDGLVDGKSPGAPSKLNADHRRALAEVVEAGPVPAVDGVVRWRRKDLARWLLETFAISLDETTVGRELKALGFAKISARPRHYAQNELAVEAFKKTSPPNWRRSGRGSRKASR